MDILRTLAETRGFFTRGEALDVDHSDQDLASALRSGLLVRFRRGYYTYADLWTGLDDVGRHVVRARAVQHALGDAVVLSHVSGAIAHGIDVWGVDLARVHVTRLDRGAGRLEGDVVHHVGLPGRDDPADIEGLRVFAPDRCVVEAASFATSEQALVLFDSFLHRNLGEHTDLTRRFERMRSWPKVRHLHIPIRMADGKAESPGESRGRWLFGTAGLPPPTLQFEVRRSDGTIAGVSDWAWKEYGLLGEFDGKVKYGRLLRPGESAGDAVFREKHREDELRELTTWPMVRLIWSDYDRPVVTIERVRRFLHRAA